MFRKSLISNVFCLLAASAALAAPARPVADTASEVTAGEATRAADGQVSTAPTQVGGPILSEDPEVRQQIRDLYAETVLIREETFDTIKALDAEYLDTADPVAREAIAAQLSELKAGFEIRTMELQLQIAVLNEDVRRVDEIELGLERARNPEAYRAQFIDPSLGQQRLLESGLE